ncbi:PREDICTED: E3 ubiquitin-protein ligase RFWD3-like [Camelina sativa]|uniref:RING-type E3 ubiquitin transferase n=1 Tax=Camelina sativa TaxID=90675 RepID=A0ABM0Y3Y4_CAMSA|nr:PREDICTED: E3 ubiquitin-protein ligase RFWD3-like [Camelina sativa]
MPHIRRYVFNPTGITRVVEEEYDDQTEPQTRGYIHVNVTASTRVSLNEREHQKSSSNVVSSSSSSGSQEDIESRCSICMEVWTNGGEHQVSCLPCGHLYGFSCINKWLQLRPSSGKCPQCNRACSFKDVVKIYASKIAAVDDEGQKRIVSLEAKLSSVEEKTRSLSNKEARWREKKAELRLEITNLRKKMYQDRHGHDEPSYSFKHHKEVLVNGGRIFEINGGRQNLLLARRLSGSGGTFVLTQINLHTGKIDDDILLPRTTRAIQDLRLSPHNNGLAVFGSLGKNLSFISLDSHNTVLSYDHLPAAPLSCSWDLNSCHHVYAGLQNGTVLVFDMRQNKRPLASLAGVTSNPVHTIHHLSAYSTPTSDVGGELLSASSTGLCQWNISGSEGKPTLVSETRNLGTCTASSYCPRTSHVVATYRRRAESSDNTIPAVNSTDGVYGFHVGLKRRVDGTYSQKQSSTQAIVKTIILPKTAIIDFGMERRQLFASYDDSTRELILQDPSSFTVSQRFALSSPHLLQDVKYAHLNGSGLLGLLTDDRFQLLRN